MLKISTGEETLRFLQDSAGIGNDDIVLEIGCGIGRVGKVAAPLCRKWIGCDVASKMLSLTAERLKDLSNVELVEISGYNLSGSADASVDVVYCTVVFMHLEPWDRYNYVLEAFRVLRLKVGFMSTTSTFARMAAEECLKRIVRCRPQIVRPI